MQIYMILRYYCCVAQVPVCKLRVLSGHLVV